MVPALPVLPILLYSTVFPVPLLVLAPVYNASLLLYIFPANACVKFNFVWCVVKQDAPSQSGYALNSDKTQCVGDSSTIVTCADSNCDTCLNSLPGTCLYCKDGYFAQKGKCVALPCLTQDENGKCATCPSDYLVVDGYCYPKCNGHSCTVQVGLFTKKCDNECLLCIFDQLYEHADCTPATYCNSIPNCIQCRKNEVGYCDRCAIGYSRKNGECFKCHAQNCLKCEYTSDVQKCSICMNNYDIDSTTGLCVKNSTSILTYPSNKRETTTPTPLPQEPSETPAQGDGSIKCTVQNCDVCSSRNYCASCKTGYEVKKGSCTIPCNIENCDHCIIPNTCATCRNIRFKAITHANLSAKKQIAFHVSLLNGVSNVGRGIRYQE